MPEALFIDGVGGKRLMHVPDERPEYLVPLPRTGLSMAGVESPYDCRITVAVFKRSAERRPNGMPVYFYERTDLR